MTNFLEDFDGINLQDEKKSLDEAAEAVGLAESSETVEDYISNMEEAIESACTAISDLRVKIREVKQIHKMK